jgi:hypothetical protein
MNEIDKYQKQELTWDNKPVRNTEDEVVTILAPMFAMFAATKVDGNTVDAYVMMLRNVDPAVLRPAVLKAMDTCKFLPTVADIREHIAATVLPGPSSHVDPKQLKDVPSTMFRLDPEEDKRQRMNQLRRTQGWN